MNSVTYVCWCVFHNLTLVHVFIFIYSYFMSTPKSHPDIKWVENAKTLFKVRTHVASTIYAQVQVYYLSWNTDVDLQPGLITQSVSFYDVMCLLQDLYLHKFFQHCQLMTSEGNSSELIRYLKVILFFYPFDTVVYLETAGWSKLAADLRQTLWAAFFISL